MFDQEPWPAWSGGARRFGALASGLADAFDTTVLLAPHTDESADERPANLRVVRSDRDRSRAKSAVEIAQRIPRWPIHSGFYRRASVRRDFAAVINEAQPDAVYVHRIAGAAMVDGLVEPRRTILDLDNAEHLRFATLADTSRGLTRWQHRADVPLIRRWLRRSLPEYGAVLLASDDDLEAVKAIAPDANFAMVPNGADIIEPRPDPGGSVVLFLGDHGYAPNAEGLAWLRAEVLPKLPQELGVVVRVVGRGRVPQGDDIVAVGPVADLAPEWARAVVLVVPLRAGAGTRLKMLDAFAAGVPVVGTSLGVGGVGAVDGEHALIADDAESMVNALVRIVSEPATRARLASAGHNLVCARFAWPIVRQQLVDVVHSLCGANDHP